MPSIPHPIPYQGSKRKFAERIFSTFPQKVERMYEPFIGSAAMTIYAGVHDYAEKYIIGDTLSPLVALHEMIIERPEEASEEYRKVWSAAGENPNDYYYEIRERYNEEKRPIDLLYCIARCVANAVRFGKDERFTQSVDKRRIGMKPDKMAKQIFGVSSTLKGRVEFRSGDWLETISDATPNDLIYMDPPYLGTSSGRDKRYHQQLDYSKLCDGLKTMRERGLRFALSYDGSTGEKTYAPLLPDELQLERIELIGGLSSQSTLNGKKEVSIESLYLTAEMNQLTLPTKTVQCTLL